MKIKKFNFVLSFFLLIASICSLAQEEHTTYDKPHFQHHRLALFTGYGLIQGAIDENGSSQFKLIPVIGVDYDYFLNHKIGIGLHNDIELSSYIVEKNHQEYLEREYAVVSALVFLYEPIIGWEVFAGPGYEFEINQGFPLFKIGTEVSKNFQDGWSMGISVVYDIKKVNSSLSFGMTAAKRLGK